MDEGYRRYYESFFDAARAWPGVLPAAGPPAEFDDARRIHDAVARVSARAKETWGVSLRADAELFLYLNAWQLVFRPVVAVRRVPASEVQRRIESDMELVVARAARSSPAQAEISGHQIVDALAESWDELEISSFELWEH